MIEYVDVLVTCICVRNTIKGEMENRWLERRINNSNQRMNVFTRKWQAIETIFKETI